MKLAPGSSPKVINLLSSLKEKKVHGIMYWSPDKGGKRTYKSIKVIIFNKKASGPIIWCNATFNFAIEAPKNCAFCDIYFCDWSLSYRFFDIYFCDSQYFSSWKWKFWWFRSAELHHIFLNFVTLIFAIERDKVHFCDI